MLKLAWVFPSRVGMDSAREKTLKSRLLAIRCHFVALVPPMDLEMAPEEPASCHLPVAKR